MKFKCQLRQRLLLAALACLALALFFTIQLRKENVNLGDENGTVAINRPDVLTERLVPTCATECDLWIVALADKKYRQQVRSAVNASLYSAGIPSRTITRYSPDMRKEWLTTFIVDYMYLPFIGTKYVVIRVRFVSGYHNHGGKSRDQLYHHLIAE